MTILSTKEKVLSIAVPILTLIACVIWMPHFGIWYSSSRVIKDLDYGRVNKMDKMIKNFYASVKDNKLHSEMPLRGWERNPFYLSETLTEENVEEWPLKGIYWDEENPSALIGEGVITVGDRLGIYTVTNIQPGFVVISNGRQVIKIRMKDDIGAMLNNTPK